MGDRGKTTVFPEAKVSRKGEEDATRMACPRMLLAHGHSSGTTKKPRQCRGFFTSVWSGLPAGQRFLRRRRLPAREGTKA